MPGAIELQTTTAAFNRQVSVFDVDRQNGERLLGRTMIFRLPGFGQPEILDVTVAAAGGTRLKIAIDDGDSPELEGATFAAVMRKPALIFALGPNGDDDVSATLYFGGRRVTRPIYDVASLLPSGEAVLSGDEAQRAAFLYEGKGMSQGKLDGIRANELFDEAPLLGFAMRAGAVVNHRLYTHQKTLELQPSTDGLSRVKLAASDLAKVREDLADIRLVDDSGAQWPYLIEATDREKETLGVEFDSSTFDAATHYTLQLPAAPITIDQLRLEIGEEFFDREFRVVATTDEHKESTLAQGRLQRAMGDPSPAVVDFTATRLKALQLIVLDGNDAPLNLSNLRVRVQLVDLLVAAPAGDYRLMLGFPDDSPPIYELARLRNLLMAMEGGAATLGDLVTNPEFKAYARLKAGEGPQNTLLWIVLIAAVLILGAITLRLARSGPEPPTAEGTSNTQTS